jgi:hypothetical protein
MFSAINFKGTGIVDLKRTNIHTIVFFGFIHEKSQVDYEESNTLFYIICTFLYR